VAGPKQVAIAACGANEVECGCGGQQAQAKNDHHLVDGVTEKFSARFSWLPHNAVFSWIRLLAE
jgi:hypothetical protein